MKVLFDHGQPFLLAHGGFQVQIEQTKAALESVGVAVEFLRWWDAAQTGDLIHYFGRAPETYIQLAQGKRKPVVMSELLGGLGARSSRARMLQRAVMGSARRSVPGSLLNRLAWRSFTMADAVIALTPWEASLMTEMFQAPAGRVHVVPNGVEEVFFQSAPEPRGPWLVCTGTITEVKRSVELAQAAVAARVPLWFIGRPYDEQSPYVSQFLEIARGAPEFVRYEGPMGDRAALARVYRQARGFVLLSQWESLSLAALEAAACGCPLLLADLPWAHSVFGDRASYCPVPSGTGQTARRLRSFHEAAPSLPGPEKPKTWREVAVQLRAVYQRVLSTSR